MTTLVQILNNRERRLASNRMGQVFNWRERYPNYSEDLSKIRSSDHTIDLSLEEESKDSCSFSKEDQEYTVPDFLRPGGAVFISDTTDQELLNAKYLSTSLIPGLYKKVRRYPMHDLSLDDLADASKVYD